MAPHSDPFTDLLARQDGVASRQQLLMLGWTSSEIAHKVRSGRWATVHPGVYATFTGPWSFAVVVRGALLHAGPTAVASHRTAGLLQDLVDQPPATIDVCVDEHHRVLPRPRLRVHRRRSLDLHRRPAATVPQTRVEVTVLDLVDTSTDPEDAVGWLTGACQRRLTTPDRLVTAASARSRLRWRSLVREVLADVQDGVASPLERRYLTQVEQRHDLPRSSRNRRIVVNGTATYADVRYEEYGVRIELEGLAWHPKDRRWHDAQRDNVAVLSGDMVLRYDWRAVTAHPCVTAAQVTAVLQSRGRQVQPRACSAACAVRHLG